jgi:putative nucleotidyltransferase with HDIG domain
MRVLLNILLVSATLFACYVEDIYLYLKPPTPERSIAITIRSRQTFAFDQEKALDEKRRKAISSYTPLFSYLPENIETSKSQMGRLIMQVYNLQSSGKSGTPKLIEYMQAEFGITITKAQATRMLRYRDLVKLLSGILSIQESILQRKIYQDSEVLKGKTTLDIILPDPGGTVTVATGEVISLDNARLLLQEKITNLLWQVDKRILDILIQLSMASLKPNLKYSQELNDKRIEAIVDKYPAEIVLYSPGDVLIPMGRAPGEEGQLLLEAYLADRQQGVVQGAVWNLSAIILTVFLFNLLSSKIIAGGSFVKPPMVPLLALLPGVILFLRAFLVFTPFPLFSLPFCILPFLLVLLCYQRVLTMWATAAGAMLVCLFTGNTFELFLYFAFSGFSAVLLTTNIKKRIQILIPSLSVGGINAVVVAALNMETEPLMRAFWGADGLMLPGYKALIELIPVTLMGWAFLAGLVAGPLALVLLALMDMSSNSTSAFKLNRFADLQHPLMKELLTKSPGTYQHTMTVAYLAQAVGQAVRANVLLLQIGAYYHDMGKVMNPNFFTENQFSGKNSHDDLVAEESSEIIINHVREGRMMAKAAGLPDVVVDLISQHHGTQLVEYFFHKAAKDAPDLKPDQSDFRYPGPKPQTLEAAILMMVDTVEAASRSIEDPTREKLAKLVNLTIHKKLADGQFDECDMTTRHLGIIIKTLVDALEASLHSRVKYPWQQKQTQDRPRRKRIRVAAL